MIELVSMNIEIPNMGDLDAFILINSVRKLQRVSRIAIPNNLQEEKRGKYPLIYRSGHPSGSWEGKVLARGSMVCCQASFLIDVWLSPD